MLEMYCFVDQFHDTFFVILVLNSHSFLLNFIILTAKKLFSYILGLIFRKMYKIYNLFLKHNLITFYTFLRMLDLITYVIHLLCSAEEIIVLEQDAGE